MREVVLHAFCATGVALCLWGVMASVLVICCDCPPDIALFLMVGCSLGTGIGTFTGKLFVRLFLEE